MSSSSSDSDVPDAAERPSAANISSFTFAMPAAKTPAPSTASIFGSTAAKVIVATSGSDESASKIIAFSKYATSGTSLFDKPAASGTNNERGGLFGTAPVKPGSLFSPDTTKPTESFGSASIKSSNVFGQPLGRPTSIFGGNDNLFGSTNIFGSIEPSCPDHSSGSTVVPMSTEHANTAILSGNDNAEPNASHNSPFATPASSGSASHNALFSFDLDGMSIHVMYHGSKVIGKVSPTAMAMASPVWRALIYPNADFPEKVHTNQETDCSGSRTPKPALCSTPVDELDLSGDDGDALLLLLHFVHYQPGKAPTTAVTYLHKVAVLCEKYECVRLIGGPWLSLWTPPLELTEQSRCMEMLFTAYTFGNHDLFDKVGISMVKNIQVNRDGMPTTLAGRVMDISLLPSSIDSILKIRLATIDKLLSVIYSAFNKYVASTDILCDLKKEDCDALVIGRMIKSAKRGCIWPRKRAKDICFSVESLAQRIRSFDTRAFHTATEGQCIFKFDFNKETAEVLQSIPNHASEAERKHMDGQLAKLKGKN